MGKIQEFIIRVDEELHKEQSPDAKAELEEMLEVLIRLRDCHQILFTYK